MLKKIKIILKIYKQYNEIVEIKNNMSKLRHLMNVKKGQQKRAKKRRFSKTARAVIWKHSGGMCEQPDCHATDNLTFDHIIPLSKGGANHSSNGQVLCLIHNQKKGANI